MSQVTRSLQMARNPCIHSWQRRADHDTRTVLRFRCAHCERWGEKRFGKPDSTIRFVTEYVLGCWDQNNHDSAERLAAHDKALRSFLEAR